MKLEKYQGEDLSRLLCLRSAPGLLNNILQALFCGLMPTGLQMSGQPPGYPLGFFANLESQRRHVLGLVGQSLGGPEYD